MRNKQGSIIGGVLLIGGSCIGAGMLGLPIVTGLCGFKLSLVIFILSWAFMTSTGLLLVEVNGWFTTDVDLISMLDHALGKWAKIAGWLLYLFLFYSLLIAYLAGIGMATSSINKSIIITISPWLGSTFFAFLISTILIFGINTTDICNRIFMTGKIGCYLVMVFLGIFYIDTSLLQRSDVRYIFASLPIMVISFGFHNLIPTITKYMHGNLSRVKLSIVLGSSFVLIIYVIWDLVVLGIMPKHGDYGIINSLKLGRDASQAIVGILHNHWIARFAAGLAFFSYLTSMLLQSLAVTHFLGDGLKNRIKMPWLIIMTVLPPLIFSILNPTIFFKALDFAGGICAVILFGIFPVMMVWNGRYNKNFTISRYRFKGGKPLLLIIFLFAVFIICFQLNNMLL